MANYLEIESVFKNDIPFGYFPIIIQIKKKFIENFFWGESQTLKLKKINFNNLLKISLTNWKLMFFKEMFKHLVGECCFLGWGKFEELKYFDFEWFIAVFQEFQIFSLFSELF